MREKKKRKNDQNRSSNKKKNIKTVTFAAKGNCAHFAKVAMASKSKVPLAIKYYKF